MVNALPPAGSAAGLMLVSVSGAATVLKFANTSVSPFAVKFSGLAIPVRS
jgi:hypothetical protein